ncbi:MAG: hypothetical protein L6R28_05935 [Planctomycetes bacterium]|nr:hypothetical protein [Planctomycetota bacterium]
MEEQTKRRRFRWPRISLRSLVLLAVFSGAAWTTWYHWKPWVLVREAQVPETLEGQDWSGSSSHGDGLVAYAYGGTLFQVWDLDAARPMLTGKGDTSLYSYWFEPDRTRAVFQTQSRRAAVWDVPAQRELAQLQGVEDYLLDVFFLDGGRLVTLEKNALRVICANTGECQSTFSYKDRPATNLWFLPGRDEVLVLFGDGTLGIQPLAAGAPLAELTVKAEPIPLGMLGVQVSAKGTCIGVRGPDGKPGAIVDAATRAIRSTPKFLGNSMYQPAKGMHVPFDREPAKVWVVAGPNDDIEILDADTLEAKCRLATSPHNAVYIDLAANANRLTMCARKPDGSFTELSFWDLATGDRLPSAATLANFGGAVDPDMERFVSTGNSNWEALVKSAQTGEILDSLGTDLTISSDEEIQFTANGRRIYSTDVQQRIRVWERRREETAWGVFGLVDTWVAMGLLLALVASLWSDRRYFAARESRFQAQAPQPKPSAPSLPADVRPAAEAKTPTA